MPKNNLAKNMMHENIKYYAYVFLVLRALIDLILAGIIAYKNEGLMFGIIYLILCGIFQGFLFFGIKNEQFSGSHNREVSLYGEPVAYWFVVGFLVVFHLGISVFMVKELLL